MASDNNYHQERDQPLKLETNSFTSLMDSSTKINNKANECAAHPDKMEAVLQDSVTIPKESDTLYSEEVLTHYPDSLTSSTDIYKEEMANSESKDTAKYHEHSEQSFAVAGNEHTKEKLSGFVVCSPQDIGLQLAYTTQNGQQVLLLVPTSTAGGTHVANVPVDKSNDLGRLLKLRNDGKSISISGVPTLSPAMVEPSGNSEKQDLAGSNQVLNLQDNSTETVVGHVVKMLDGQTMYVCDLDKCGRSFSSFGYLRFHQSCHFGTSDLVCPYPECGRKFSWPAHLKYHQLTHTNARLFRCEVDGCQRSFYTAQRLKVHLQTHTGEKPFKCTTEGCGRSFTTAQNLRNHVRTHTGEKPYQCSLPMCKRRFTEFSSLKKHMLTHTGEKPHPCRFCGKSFSQAGTRNAHIKKQHSDLLQAEKLAEERARLGTGNDSSSMTTDAQASALYKMSSVEVQNGVVVSEEMQYINVQNMAPQSESDAMSFSSMLVSNNGMSTNDNSSNASQSTFKGDEFINNPNVLVLTQPPDNSNFVDCDSNLEIDYAENITTYEENLLQVELQSEISN